MSDSEPEGRTFAGCFPESEADRETLRQRVNCTALPAKHEGASVMPCFRCGMKLSVGPLLVEKITSNPDIKPTCIECFIYISKTDFAGMTPVVQNINPNSTSGIECGGCGTVNPDDAKRCAGCWKELNYGRAESD